MAPPNTLFIPENAEPHANAIFMEIMDFLTMDLGVVDFAGPDGRGGDIVNRPRIGQISSGFERADVTGTLTTSATATTTTNTDEKMVFLHRTLFHEFYPVTSVRANLGPDAYAAEIGRQIAIKAGQRVLADIYNSNIAAATSVADDHVEDVYVDDTDATDQVDLSPAVIQDARFLLADHLEKLDVGVANSKAWNDLTKTFLTATNIYQVPNIIGELIRGGMYRNVQGARWVVDDQLPTSAGPTGGSPLKYNTLLFRSRDRNPAGEAPVEVRMLRPLMVHKQHVLGQQSRKNQLQAEMAYAIGIRGKQWDTASVAANPTDVQLATDTNWDDSYDDHRQHGAVLIVSN